jgi:lysophospholipase L1-like esterase
VDGKIFDQLTRAMAAAPTRRGLLAGAAAAIAASIVRNGRSTRAQHVGTLQYFALGDSVASGHGLLDDGPPCRQSTKGYPFVLAGMLWEARPDLSLVFPEDKSHLLACSLSLSGSEGRHDLSRQVDTLAALVGSATDEAVLVTITTGMNDIWGDPARFGEMLLSILSKPDGLYAAWLESTIDAIEIHVADAIRRTLEFGPKVAVVVSGYYNPMNPRFFESPLDSPVALMNSAFAKLWRSFEAVCEFQDCYARTNQLIETLNAGLRSAVTEAGSDRVRFDDSMYQSFKGHASVCGLEQQDRADTWVQSPIDRESNSLGSIFGRPELVGLGDCIHPNTRGALAIAAALETPALALLDLIAPAPPPSPERGD